jgi:hypothetical protein
MQQASISGPEYLGVRLRIARKQQALMQNQLAEAAGVKSYTSPKRSMSTLPGCSSANLGPNDRVHENTRST